MTCAGLVFSCLSVPVVFVRTSVALSVPSVNWQSVGSNGTNPRERSRIACTSTTHGCVDTGADRDLRQIPPEQREVSEEDAEMVWGGLLLSSSPEPRIEIRENGRFGSLQMECNPSSELKESHSCSHADHCQPRAKRIFQNF